MSHQGSTRRGLAVAATAALIVTAGCGGPTINAQRDPNVAIPANAAWMWGTRDTVSQYELDPVVQNPMLHQMVQRAIEVSLQGKGFRKVDNPNEAQLIVTYHMGLKRSTEYVTTTTGVGVYGGYGGYGWGHYGAPYMGGMSSSTTRPVEYAEGGVLVLIRDRRTGALAWQGLYKKDVHDVSQPSSQERIQQAANDLFQELRP